MTARTLELAGRMLVINEAMPDLFRAKRDKLRRARLELTGDGIEPNWWVNGVGWTVRPPGMRCDRVLTCP